MPATILLANYWLDTDHAHPGQTIWVTYVISNESGLTVQLKLGASIKAHQEPSWTSGVINDPAHDVVAVVPPGTTTHLRAFTLPCDLLPGRYDVAWGLRNTVTGARVALVSVPDLLQIIR